MLALSLTAKFGKGFDASNLRNMRRLYEVYATYQMNSQLFVQKYRLYQPDREALRHELEKTLCEAEQ